MSDFYARLALQLIASASQTSSTSVATDVDLVATFRRGYEARLGGDAAIHRVAGQLGAAFTVRGGLFHPEVLHVEESSFAPGSFEHSVEISALPSLHAPRDRLRAPYDRTSTTLRFDLIHTADDFFTMSVLPLHITVAHDAQELARRTQVDLSFSIYRWCRATNDAAASWCLDIFPIQIDGADGPLDVNAGLIAPVALENLVTGGWSVDAMLGYRGGSIMIPGGPPGDADTSCEDTGGCVTLRALGYDFGARRTEGDAEVTLRAHRTTYPTLTGELALDDRAEASVRWPHGKLTLAAHGFAAKTRWWTLDGRSLAPVGDAITGGGDVTVSRAIAGWTVDVTAEAARSFYAVADGGAPRAQLGAQGTVSLGRALERTW